MGYGSRDVSNGQRHPVCKIQTFWPDDDDSTFYIESYASLGCIMSKAAEKWPGASVDDIEITAEYIHTDCLGYDLFDSSDYTNFLRVTRISHA